MTELKEYVDKAKKIGISKKELIPELLKKGYSNEEIEQAFGVINGKPTETGQLEFFDKIKLLFSNPAHCFEMIKDPHIGKSLVMFVLTSLVVFAVWIGLYFFLSRAISSGFGIFTSFFTIIPLIFGLITTFVYSGISHLIIIAMNGKGSYVDTYNVITYSFIPFLLISLFPYIGFLSIAYSIILMTFGLSTYHKISKGKAVVAAIVPILIMIVLLVLFIIFLFMALAPIF